MHNDDELQLDANDAPTYAADVEVFKVVVEAMQRLNAQARARVIRTLLSFFDLDLVGNYPRTQSGSSRSPAGVPTSGPVASFSEDRAPSPKDFLREKRPGTDVERVACLAYYLTHYRNTPHFKTVDLSALNTEAAQVKLSNPAQAVDNATKTGLLVPAVKGAKQLSVLGEEYVRALPDRDAAREAIAHARPKRKGKKKPSATLSGASSTPDT